MNEMGRLAIGMILVAGYFIGNIFLMVYIGLGGEIPLITTHIKTEIGLYWAYLVVVFFCVYVVLIKMDKLVRRLALLGISIPWIYILFLVTPQINEEPYDVAKIWAFFVGIWIIYFLGETLVTIINEKSNQ